MTAPERRVGDCSCKKLAVATRRQDQNSGQCPTERMRRVLSPGDRCRKELAVADSTSGWFCREDGDPVQGWLI